MMLGPVLVSLMTATFSRNMALNPREGRLMATLDRDKLEAKVLTTAVRIIQSWMRGRLRVFAAGLHTNYGLRLLVENDKKERDHRRFDSGPPKSLLRAAVQLLTCARDVVKVILCAVCRGGRHEGGVGRGVSLDTNCRSRRLQTAHQHICVNLRPHLSLAIICACLWVGGWVGVCGAQIFAPTADGHSKDFGKERRERFQSRRV